MDYHIKDIDQAEEGLLRIEWANQSMPVLNKIKERFLREQPLKDVLVVACLHVTTETASLISTLKAGGAEPVVCASNPLSTQDDVAASLVKFEEVPVYSIKGEDNDTYYSHINSALDHNPTITLDDGADLVSIIHKERTADLDRIVGGTEETTTGVIRLRSMANQGMLKYPIISVNDANTKHLFDNRYGTGQSTIDGIIRATNRLISGSVFVVCGYGWCGRGLAMRARGMGAKVIVTEVSPLRGLEAVMDGYDVMTIEKAAGQGDFFVTVTGDIDVIRREHFLAMKDGAIVANSGHFNVELETSALEDISVSKRTIRTFVEEFLLEDGRRINLLGEGRLINLTAAEGHPSSVMDMSFANQALAVEYMVKHGESLSPAVHPVPPELDDAIAAIKLESMGIDIDELTDRQKEYLSSWEMGT